MSPLFIPWKASGHSREDRIHLCLAQDRHNRYGAQAVITAGGANTNTTTRTPLFPKHLTNACVSRSSHFDVLNLDFVAHFQVTFTQQPPSQLLPIPVPPQVCAIDQL